MERDIICPKFSSCPIYSGDELSQKKLKEIYRNQFCERGEKQFSKCKRYMVIQLVGESIPVKVVPNSAQSIEEILEMIYVLAD